MATVTKPLTVYLPDTRGVVQSRFGLGNLKIGANVFTYSRLPGSPERNALGAFVDEGRVYTDLVDGRVLWHGTCPGSTPECERICYARRPVREQGPVAGMWLTNSVRSDVPPIPEECRLLRIHVSGDFDSIVYILNWIDRIKEHVTAHGLDSLRVWAYTRSWRVPELLPALERLRALPCVQLFASMDKSTVEMPPDGWRRAWIDGDPRGGEPRRVPAHSELAGALADFTLQHTGDGVKTLICPEETKAVRDCEACGFCFAGPRNDVTFLEH